MVMPSSPPPPPIPEEGPPQRVQSEKKKKRRSMSRDSLDNRKGVPLNGDLFFPSHVNGQGSQWIHPLTAKDKVGGFYGSQKVPVGPPAPMLIYGAPSPSPFVYQYGTHFSGFLPQNGRHVPRTAEEATYFAKYGRKYQPNQYPQEAYFGQEKQANPVKPKSNRYKKGKNGQSSDSNAEDSEFGNTASAPRLRSGLQREQRSKSQGSLSQIGGNFRQNSKEELELVRMMGDLNASEEDFLERFEVPPGLFPPGHPPNYMSGGPFIPLPPPPQRMSSSDLQRRKR
jgi:hypothetical protein